MAPFLKGLIGWNLLIIDNINNFLIKWHLKKQPPKTLPVCKDDNVDENCVPSNQSLFKNVLKNNKETVKNLLISNERIAKIYAVLWYARKANRLPLLILTSFRLLLVMFFIMTAIHQFLTENTKMIFVVLVISLFIISRSQWLLDQYLKMEKQFLHNLNGEEETDDNTQNKGENL